MGTSYNKKVKFNPAIIQKVDNFVKSSMEMRRTLLPYNNTCNDRDLYLAVKVLIAEMFG